MESFIKWAVFLIIFIGVFIYFWNNYQGFSSSTPNEGGGFSWRNFFTFNKASSTYGFSFPSWTPNFGSPASYGVVGNIGGTSISTPGYLPDAAIPAGFTRSQISPYFGQIKLSSVTASTFGNTNLFQLYSSLPAGKKANITGWHVKGNRTDVAIPRAVDNYNPYSLNDEGDIIISQGSVVSIYQGTSPLSRNFRLNECAGFLQNTYKFNPSIPQNCPQLYSRSDITGFAGYCQTYIMSLGSCQLPSTAFVNSLPGSPEGNICQQYLSTLTVNSCYDKHFSDAGFLSNTWVLWISQLNAFDPQHDTVYLYDNKGLLVDKYVY
ncbi:MAG: hypothetical protein NTW60_03440 [Candidatus Wolfebacteria bacterium]|nr:hypothetical protein [Candidatus Wolfebacteria bacterium]